MLLRTWYVAATSQLEAMAKAEQQLTYRSDAIRLHAGSQGDEVYSGGKHEERLAGDIYRLWRYNANSYGRWLERDIERAEAA